MQVCSDATLYHYLLGDRPGTVDAILREGLLPLSDQPGGIRIEPAWCETEP